MRNSLRVEKARMLRNNGLSILDISKTLHINTGTISRWVNGIEVNIPLKPGIVKNQKEERLKAYNQDSVKFSSLTSLDAQIFVSLLYWCEDAKYPSSSFVGFTSSDVDMQISFITLFLKAFLVDEAKFRVYLQLHTTHNVNETKQFWSNKLDIPIHQFHKPHVTEKKGGRYREGYQGTCTLKYYDYRVLLRMMGIYKRFSAQIQSKFNLV